MTLPPVPDSFAWEQSSCGLVLKCRPFDRVAPHLFTTRQLPLSSREDWHRLARAMDAAQVVGLRQVHGRGVVVIRRGSQPAAEPAAGDVLVSDDPTIAVAVRAADCVPVLLADPQSGAVAAVHAGWRGVAAGAVGAAVEALGREFDARPEQLRAAIGPHIGVCCYDVGSDVVDAFAAAGHPRHLIDRWFQTAPPARGTFPGGLGDVGRPQVRLDLAAACRDQLVLAGLGEDRIHASGLCTAMHLHLLTSYRAEKDRAVRIAGVIRAPGSP